MPHRAKLDHDRVYWGVEEVEALAPDDVEVPADCDLKPGMYRWDGATFALLAHAQRKSAPEAPTIEQAFYDLLTTGPEAPRVVAWRDWMKQTMDERLR